MTYITPDDQSDTIKRTGEREREKESMPRRKKKEKQIKNTQTHIRACIDIQQQSITIYALSNEHINGPINQKKTLTLINIYAVAALTISVAVIKKTNEIFAFLHVRAANSLDFFSTLLMLFLYVNAFFSLDRLSFYACDCRFIFFFHPNWFIRIDFLKKID